MSLLRLSAGAVDVPAAVDRPVPVTAAAISREAKTPRHPDVWGRRQEAVMGGTLQGAANTPFGEASQPQSGAARSLSDLTTEELLELPPFPIRHPDFINRFPVPIEQFEALNLAAREPVQTPLGPDGQPDAQVDAEAPTQAADVSVPEDGDWGAGHTPLAPPTLANFEGIPQTAFRPPDCTLAVGPDDVMVAVNVDLVGYTKAGSQRFRWANFTAMFNPVIPPNAQMFDPKLAYDHYANRWIVCIAARRPTPQQGSWILMGVSQTPDPAGAYWIWATDATVDGSTASTNWSDYPMLGFDTQAIYVSTNQFAFAGGFSYAKVRIFNKAELYAGGVGGGHSIRWWDFTRLRNGDNSLAFSVQPAVHFQGVGGNPPAFLVNSLFPRGSSLTLWTLSNPLGLWSGGAPTLTSAAVACRSYDLPPDAVQRDGGTVRIETNDTRLLNAVFQFAGGVRRLWTTHTSAFTWPGDTEARSVVQWYEIHGGTRPVIQQNPSGPGGPHSFSPPTQPDPTRNAYVPFGRWASDEYGQLRHTGRLATDPAGQLQNS